MTKPVKLQANAQQQFLNSTTGLTSRAIAGLAVMATAVFASQQAEAACTPVVGAGGTAGVTVGCSGGLNTNVNATVADRVIINWSNFNTSLGEKVNFTQQ